MFLSFLRPPAALAHHPERRSIPRHEPSSSRARVAWREIDFRFEKASVRLLDFSEKGARVLSSVYPRVGRTIWVGLAALPHEWVKAEVRSAELSGNQWVCRLEFLEPCSAGMLEIAFLETRRK